MGLIEPVEYSFVFSSVVGLNVPEPDFPVLLQHWMREFVIEGILVGYHCHRRLVRFEADLSQV